MSLIAPWLRNTLRLRGTAGTIQANFDRTVTAPPAQNVNGSAGQQNARIGRPGAILLANLDIDETGGRARFGAAALDALNDTVDGGNDNTELTLFQVAELNPLPAVTASLIIVSVDGADTSRVRAWKIPAANRMRDGGEPAMGLLQGVIHAPGDSVIGHWVKSAPAWTYFYGMEAITLAGDPRAPAPTTPAPHPPGRRQARPRGDRGSEASAPSLVQGQQMYAARGPGDIWVTLEHYTWSEQRIPDLADQALFTIAPWLMTWNTLACERVYVMYDDPNVTRGRNHPMVWDLQQACQTAGLANGAPYAPSPDSTVAITPNVRGDIVIGTEIPFYVIAGALVGATAYGMRGDQWVQDELEIGYCWAPHAWMHVVLHCPRERATSKLGLFVETHMPHAGLGLFNGVVSRSMFGPGPENFGGNLEVSPPVLNPTPAILADNAGLAVKRHRAAPFGKIIWGDGDPTNTRRCLGPYRDFLRAQLVQPILPIDTSWLTVAHVDEILTFIRAGGVRANGDHTFKLLFADFDALEVLYTEARGQYVQAAIHAGKYREALGVENYDERLVSDLLADAEFTASRLLQTNRLTPIEARLRTGLDIPAADVIPVPSLFTDEVVYGQTYSTAATPGMMNLLVVNDHLMIPRPFGPRLPRAAATTALGNALTQIFNARGVAVPVTAVPAAPGAAGGDGLWFWAAPGVTLDEITSYFIDPVDFGNPRTPRRRIIAAIRANQPVPATYAAEHALLRNAILNHGLNTGATTPILTAMGGGGAAFTHWMKIWIPDGRVDISEAYMASVLAGTGNTLHFIDDFESYHAHHGEVHCGTNAKRAPAETLPGFAARWWDARVYDTGYNTTY